jgi:hypothetical protein
MPRGKLDGALNHTRQYDYTMNLGSITPMASEAMHYPEAMMEIAASPRCMTHR